MPELNHAQLHALLTALVDTGQVTPYAIAEIRRVVTGEDVTIRQLDERDFIALLEGLGVLSQMDMAAGPLGDLGDREARARGHQSWLAAHDAIF